MRRKAAVALVAILVVLSFAGVAFATHLMTGEVIWANPSTRTLTIDTNGLVLTFDVVDNAIIDLINLRPGVKVAVHYTQAEGEQPLCHHVFAMPIGG